MRRCWLGSPPPDVVSYQDSSAATWAGTTKKPRIASGLRENTLNLSATTEDHQGGSTQTSQREGRRLGNRGQSEARDLPSTRSKQTYIRDRRTIAKLRLGNSGIAIPELWASGRISVGELTNRNSADGCIPTNNIETGG